MKSLKRHVVSDSLTVAPLIAVRSFQPTLSIMTNTKTSHLVLKHKWYDMIASGEKKEEYRDCTSYWTKRLLGHCRWIFGLARGCTRSRIPVKEKKTVTFHRGYSSTTMTWEIQEFSYGMGVPEWGAPDKKCLIIVLGKRLDDGK